LSLLDKIETWSAQQVRVCHDKVSSVAVPLLQKDILDIAKLLEQESLRVVADLRHALFVVVQL